MHIESLHCYKVEVFSRKYCQRTFNSKIALTRHVCDGSEKKQDSTFLDANDSMSYREIKLKPCSVRTTRLSQEVIDMWTNSKDSSSTRHKTIEKESPNRSEQVKIANNIPATEEEALDLSHEDRLENETISISL
eukprot:TRINITY_DN16658_c0_g1_i1.p1 TRINITY_DN16658_c0_g1~~TRINITY_DN16658_c0_g1_i1.p1  ORF type:complete len:134 (+),score=9.70 TRINITY_DN16658_c0_g1_i1:264-665(+)